MSNVPQNQPAAPLSETRVNAMLGALQVQRDSALHHVVNLTAALAEANETIRENNRRLGELMGEIDALQQKLPKPVEAAPE